MHIELARRCKGMWRKRGGAGEEGVEHAREKRRGREWNGVKRCEHTRR